MRLALDHVFDFCQQVLVTLATPADIAADVAHHLVESDRAGYPSHGVSILPSYRDALRAGGIVADAQPACLRDEGAVLAWDGRQGFGQHVGKRVLEAGIERARRTGLCALTLRDSNHLGRLGSYGEQAVAAGMALLMFTNVIGRGAMVAPFGGRQARLTTNPLCIALPMPDGRAPFVLDMATSQMAMNKVRVLGARGQPVPAGVLIDADGNPSTDPDALLRPPGGALLPFGGHKGYGLGVAVELLAGLLSGGGTVQPEHQHGSSFAINNLFAVLIDPAHFAAHDYLQREASTYLDYLLSCAPRPGFDEVEYPGQFEARNRAANADSIPVDAPTVDALEKMAAELGIAPLRAAGGE
ncbi:MAG: Ldh family oxidoreductase [Pseudoxanthomonas sp.]